MNWGILDLTDSQGCGKIGFVYARKQATIGRLNKINMTHRDELIKTVRKHTKLAIAYAEDGAFATAAKLLHESADLFTAENIRMGKILSGEIVTSAKS